jgi:hypothetical protein
VGPVLRDDLLVKGNTTTMAAQRTTFEKLQRDRAKKAKAAAKRERRLEKDAAAAERASEVTVPAEGELSAAQLLELIEQVHRQYEAKEISLEELEERRTELLARLPVS